MMRQYGAPAGNPWDSDSEIVAATARTVEGRLADEEIKEGVEEYCQSTPSLIVDDGFCPLGCCRL